MKEKAVINLAGETVFSSKSVFFNRKFDPGKIHGNTAFKSPLFRNPDIRRRILGKDKGYGVFIIDLGGRRDIYSYAHLEVWNMYFVVVADYDELVKHVESQR